MPEVGPPQLSLPRLFGRFLRFGLLAWGGPVAQIGLLREELVDRERWVDSERFNRVLGVYQALPGPEASELCIYFGMVARGRIGGLLAGLGFMLPGVLAVLTAAWLYTSHGIDGRVAAALVGAQLAALALVIRAVHRIGSHALHAWWTWLIALAVFCGMLVVSISADPVAPAASGDRVRADATPMELAGVGLAAGGLSFGGAYTTIGFVHGIAVDGERWLDDSQFLDALALSGSLPSPLIVFATFVGYVAGGLVGALVMTVAIFLPAFAITLLGHRTLERIVDEPRVHRALDAITAAVVGLIAATCVDLALAAINSVGAALLVVACLAALALWRSRAAIVAVVLGAALAAALAGMA